MTPGIAWSLTLSGLRGEPWPALPILPGRVIVARDEPLTMQDLDGIESAQELAACLGLSRQCAALRLNAYRKTNDPARLLGRPSPTRTSEP